MPAITASPELPRWRSLRSRAFTLIELIVTLVIIAVLIAVAAVSYNSVIGHSKDTATGVQLTQLYKTAAGVAALNREPLTLAHFENATAEVTLAAAALSAPSLAAGHFEVLDATTPIAHVGQVQVAITTDAAGVQVTGLAALSRDGHCVLVRGESMGTHIASRAGDCSDDAADQAQTLASGGSALPAPGPTQTTPATLAGALYGVGYNNYGQLGDGTTANRATYAQVATTGALAGKTITQIAVSGKHTCALTDDNTLACWGYNASGQLGDGTTTNRTTPATVTPGALFGKTVTQIAAGGGFTCALTSDNTVACWGQNYYGTLGDGTTVDKHTPVAVTLGALAGRTITQLAAGNNHACLLTTDGTLWCWGGNYDGQLGDGTTVDKPTPTTIASGALTGKTVTQVTAGLSHTCALTTDGTLACWGNNSYGQVGDGTTTRKPTPVAVTPGDLAGKVISQVRGGWSHTCALASDSTIACWGKNAYGTLGTGTTVDQHTPAAVTPAVLAGKTVTQLAVGSFHACALTTENTLACWGQNGSGQLGDGTTTHRATQVWASSLTGALGGKSPFAVTTGPEADATYVVAR